VDLAQAIKLEETLAPAGRPAAQQERLVASVDRYWTLVDDMFRAAGADDDNGAIAKLRGPVTAQHLELVSMVSQFLVLNNRVQEEAAVRNREIYERVEREIGVLVIVLLLVVAITGISIIRANQRAFERVEQLSAELRNLSWRMLRMQEDLQQEFSRELHDEFGQIFTAVGTLLGRVKRNLPPDSPMVADLEEVRGIAQQTLDKIRVQSRLLHPVILDDFGLEKALEWFVEQFGRQHGIDATFESRGPIGVIPPEATIHIYRIVQEALTNVGKHSGAARPACAWRSGTAGSSWTSRTRARACRRPRPAAWIAASASSACASAAELMGGTFALRPSPERGLTVSVRVPLGSDLVGQVGSSV
jgi:signal transduction histidine kinase